MSLRALALAALAVVFAGACAASAPQPAPPWKLVAAEGAVQVRDGEEAFRPVGPQDVLAIGSVLTTGADSRAELSNGLQIITVAPNSRLRIPEDRRDGVTRVLQELGKMLFQVNHEDTPHFEVLTPLATAVVKGTTFEVRVTETTTNVEVKDGLVEVRLVDGDAHKDVPTGFEARVVRNIPKELVVYRVAQQAMVAAPAGPGLRGKSANSAIPPSANADEPISLPAVGAAGAAAAPVISGAVAGDMAASSLEVRTIDLAGGASAKVATPKSEAGAGEIGDSGKPAATSAKPASSLATAPQFQRASKTDAKKDDVDAWAVAKYGAIFVGAWIIFVPIVALLRRSSQKRKAAPNQKRSSR